MLTNLNYISLDLETTGLNTQKDEPIQIGIIKFDHQLNIIKTYKSYIKPQKDIKELKDIVSFVTGLKLQDLENAPNFETVRLEIKDFFDENTIIIGQNISFDIEILKRFCELKYKLSIDTLNLAKATLHFVSSYSLEILNEVLNQKKIQDTAAFIDGNYHDALYDSYIGYKIFKYFIQKTENLKNKYPVLQNILAKSQGSYQIIFEKLSTKNYEVSNYFLPSLKKEIKSQTQIYNPNGFDFSNYTNFTKYYIGNINLKKVLSGIIGKNQKIILAFSNNNKVKIAKDIIQQLGIKNITYLKDDSILNPENINKLLSKNEYQDFEINFLIKYYSLYEEGYSVLDLNSNEDYKVYNFLKESIEKKPSNIILANHFNIFNGLKDNSIPKDYQILFFDWDLWFNSFSKFLNQPYDFYNLIYRVEHLIYKESYSGNTENLTNLYNWLLIFVGNLFSEITEKFTGVNISKIEINPIIDNIDFHKTNNLLKNLPQHLENIKNEINEFDLDILNQKIHEFIELLDNIVNIERKMFNEDKFYYVFQKLDNVINYQEFLSFFNNHDTRFFSNYDINRSIKLNKTSTLSNENLFSNITSINAICSWIDNYQNVFILCTNKNKSKELFELLFKNNYHEKYKVYIENITGGLGKNLFYCKKENKKIVIGGYEFIINLIAEGVEFEKINIYFNAGALENIIKNDISYYYAAKFDSNNQ